jgi:siroheme synthase
VLFTTFSRGESGNWLNWAAVTPETTIAIYMPGTHYGEVAARLVENGLSPETPCVVVSQATRAEQQVRWLNIASLASEEQLPAPSILLVGRVATPSIDEWSIEEWRTQLAPETFQSSAAADLDITGLKKN